MRGLSRWRCPIMGSAGGLGGGLKWAVVFLLLSNNSLKR